MHNYENIHMVKSFKYFASLKRKPVCELIIPPPYNS